MSVLTSVDSSAAWHSTVEYRYRDTNSNNEYLYDLWKYSTDTWDEPNSTDLSIKIDSSNVWSDNGSNVPHEVSTSNGVVTLTGNGGSPILYKFAYQNYAASGPASSEGGGGGGGDANSGNANSSSKKVFSNFW